MDNQTIFFCPLTCFLCPTYQDFSRIYSKGVNCVCQHAFKIPPVYHILIYIVYLGVHGFKKLFAPDGKML